MSDFLEPEFTTLGDEVWETIKTIMEEGFSDLDAPDDQAVPPWPMWLFGNTPEQEARGELVTEDMVPPAYQACIEAAVGLAADMAVAFGFGPDWQAAVDIALTYAIRVALHVQLKDHPDVFVDESILRASLVQAVNKAVAAIDEEENE